jgi:mono/diheme cytochrome c family protein
MPRAMGEGNRTVNRRALLAAACTAFISLLTVACLPGKTVHAGSTPQARGAELFATTGCAHCHGPAGIGGPTGPDLQLVRKRLSADMIAQQIRDGGKAMPAFGEDLTKPDIDDLVAYLRAKRKLVLVPIPPVVPTLPTKDPE